MKYDYTLYLVTDRNAMSTATLEEAVEQAITGGCTMVQLREINRSSLDFYRSAVNIKKITDKYDIPLIINNSAEIALAVGAAGVHIGQSDLPAYAVRKIVGNKMIIGVSAAGADEAITARNDGADYIGVGAMFPTKTKSDAKTVSFDELAKIRKAVNIPIVAIGGINKENAGVFKGTGINGISAISAIISQPDIRKAAEQLKKAYRQEN